MALISTLDNNNTTSSPTRTGRVIYSNPSMGYYAVLPDDSPVGVDGVLTAMSSNAFDSVGAGITVSSPYSVGTSVRYIQQDCDKVSPTDVVPIIGADRYVHESTDGLCHTPWTIGGDLNAIFGNNDIVTDAYLKVQNLHLTIKDRSFGTPLDMSEGEYAINGALKNYMYIGYGVSAIGGGYDNNLTFFTETNGCVFSTGGYYIHDTLISREEVYADLTGQGISVKHTAYSIAEGFGSIEAEAFKQSNNEGDSYCVPKESGQFPIYRLQELSGSIGQGRCINVSSYKIDDAPKTNITAEGKDSVKEGFVDAHAAAKDTEIVQYGVSTIQTPWDGSVNIASLNSISLDKDYYIPYPIQIATESNLPQYESLVESAPSQPTSAYASLAGKIRIYATQAASCLYTYSKLLSVARLYSSALRRIRTWKIFTFKEVSEKLGIKEEKMAPLEPYKPCYESKMVEVDDPVSKAKTLIEALSAFIHVSPSGAIVISDGHGAEIRLEGGNITISPSADLKILPGRNVIGIVPGKVELLAKERMDLASDTDVVTLKGESNVNILSSTGTVTVESASPDLLLPISEDEWIGGGIILKSAGGVSISGGNISLRRQSFYDDSNGRADMQTAGAIVIDANNGSLVTYGDNIISVAKEINAAVGKSSASVLSEAFQIASPNTLLPGNVIVGGNPSVTLSIPDITKDGVKSKQLRVSGYGRTKALVVAGNAVVTEGMAVNKIATNGIATQAIAASRGRIDSASWLSGLRPSGDGPIEPISTPNEAINSAKITANSANKSGMQIVANITSGVISVCSQEAIYKAKTLSTIKLKYPSTADYLASEFFIVESRWQKALGTSADVWQAPNLVNDSMIYPGKEKWMEEDCVYTVVAEGASKEYTYNDMFDISKLKFTLEKKGVLGKSYIINKPKE